jgi:hypothetical protein
MQRMTVHDHSIENNDISIQFLYFTRINTQYKAIKGTRTQHNLLHTAKDAIYTTFNTQSGLVHLCPPEYCWLSLLLTGEQPVRSNKGFSRYLLYVGRSWSQGSCEIFLQTINFCKVHSQAPGRAMVLEGQDSKNCTKC